MPEYIEKEFFQLELLMDKAKEHRLYGAKESVAYWLSEVESRARVLRDKILTGGDWPGDENILAGYER